MNEQIANIELDKNKKFISRGLTQIMLIKSIKIATVNNSYVLVSRSDFLTLGVSFKARDLMSEISVASATNGNAVKFNGR